MAKMPSHAEWMRTTDAGMVARRGADLERVDSALAVYDQTRSWAVLEALDLAFKNWKRKNPGWNNSGRNRTGAMTNLSKALLERVDVMLRHQDFIWCPGIDSKLEEPGREIIQDLRLDSTLYEGGSTGLEKFSASAKCYIFAHGHARMPIFTTEKGNWNSEQIAAMLRDSGLNPEIRQIEMLVCHAGQSVNSIKAGNRLYALQEQYTAAKAAGKRALVTRIEAQFADVLASPDHKDPSHYDDDRDPFTQTDEERAARIRRQSELLLPMAATLSDSLKKLGFSNFTLKSYKAPVKMHCGPMQYNGGVRSPAGVRLDLSGKAAIDPKVAALVERRDSYAVEFALASDWPEYSAIWR